MSAGAHEVGYRIWDAIVAEQAMIVMFGGDAELFGKFVKAATKIRKCSHG